MQTSYRYWLSRTWDASKPQLCWIMLNPSTATEARDDATIRRVVGFSRSWDFGSAVVVNLFALRSAAPAALARHPDPVGPENDSSIEHAVATADLVLVGWGNHGVNLNPATGAPRHSEIADLLSKETPYCLGITARGQPRHPLYLSSRTVPVAFPGLT